MNHLFKKDDKLLIKIIEGQFQDEPGWDYLGTTEHTDASILELYEETDEMGQVHTKHRVSAKKLAEKEAREQANARAWLVSQSNKVAIDYLTSTDWYVIREQETGIKIPYDVKMARQNARENVGYYSE